MWKKSICEAFGTFALVFAGTGAIIVNDLSSGQIGHIGICITFGLIVLTMIYTIGGVSGAHINPAVTMAFVLEGRFKIAPAIQYVIFQLIGALAASFLLRLLFPSHVQLGATIPAGSIGQSFVLEIVLTLILMFVILCVSTGASEKGIIAGIAVGSVVTVEALFAGPISGASMNPARSLGPAMISMQLQYSWIYIFAPLIGAMLAVVLFRFLKLEISQ